jgi:hypothetical protein
MPKSMRFILRRPGRCVLKYAISAGEQKVRKPVSGFIRMAVAFVTLSGRPEVAQRIHEVRGQVDGMGAVGMLPVRKVLPADASDPCPPADSFIGEDVAEEATVAPGLIQQREGLETLAAQLARRVERTDGQVSLALIAHDQQRIAPMSDDQHGFFEARVKAGEPGQIGEVLPVAVDNQVRPLQPVHRRTDRLDSGLELRGPGTRRRPAGANRRPVHLDQPMLSQTVHSTSFFRSGSWSATT